MKIALVQTEPIFGDLEGNLQVVSDVLADCRADLCILPELAFTGYQFRDAEELGGLAESRDGRQVRALRSMARQTGGALVAGFAEVDQGRFYNSAVLVDASGLLGIYRKVHLFDREKELFTPGDMGFPVFEYRGVVVGLMICFDWLFPEAARSLALAGAQVIVHPANLVLPYCQDAMVTRALENRVFVATANRVGIEERLDGERLVFSGKSRLVGPDGTVLLDAPQGRTGLFSAEIDPARADDKAITSRNHVLADRRTEQYRVD